MDNECIEVAVDVIKVTDDAVLVTDGDIEEWIPSSQISSYTGTMEEDEFCTITIPEWLAYDKGLI